MGLGIFSLAVIAAAGILFAMLLFKVIKGVVKMAATLMLIAVLLIAGLGAFTFLDMKDFSTNFPVEKKMFLLEDGGNFITGFYVYNISKVEFEGSENYNEGYEGNAADNSASIEPVSDDDLSVFSDYYKKGEASKIKGDNFKVFIFNRNAVGELETDKPLATAFFSKIGGRMDKEGVTYLLEEFQNGNLKVLPASTLTRIAGYVPLQPLKTFEGNKNMIEGDLIAVKEIGAVKDIGGENISEGIKKGIADIKKEIASG